MDTDDGPRTEYLRIINRKDTEIQRLLMTVEQNETEARKEQEWEAQSLSFNVRHFPEIHDNLMTLWEVPKVKL
jgi:hypothetical protein